jgi:hypothetical protein
VRKKWQRASKINSNYNVEKAIGHGSKSPKILNGLMINNDFILWWLLSWIVKFIFLEPGRSILKSHQNSPIPIHL